MPWLAHSVKVANLVKYATSTQPRGTITKLQGGVFDLRFGTLLIERQPEPAAQ